MCGVGKAKRRGAIGFALIFLCYFLSIKRKKVGNLTEPRSLPFAVVRYIRQLFVFMFFWLDQKNQKVKKEKIYSPFLSFALIKL